MTPDRGTAGSEGSGAGPVRAPDVGAADVGAADVGTADVLAAALGRLRLDGAIFFRSVFTDPFSLDATPNRVAGLLHPGARRLVMFHIVAEGHCWISDVDGDRHLASEGDVVVVPYGEDHGFQGDSPSETIAMLSLFEPPPWDRMPYLRYGGDGDAVDIVCGYLVSDDPLFDPAMRVFPSVFVVRPRDEALRRWVSASIEYALADTAGGPDAAGASVIATRLPELVVIEVLKTYLDTLPASDAGWLAALRDPVLAPALAAIHRAPERRWTVAEIAAQAAVSRSVVDERFREVLGRSPIRYLAEWRMHLAEELLATTDATVFSIARRVGYDAEEAFSRAFKRARGVSPSRWRSEHRRQGVASSP